MELMLLSRSNTDYVNGHLLIKVYIKIQMFYYLQDAPTELLQCVNTLISTISSFLRNSAWP